MINIKRLIKSANQAKLPFTESTFYLSNDNYIRLTGNQMSFAINRHKNYASEVKVLHWFDDFWLFIEMQILDRKKSISISIFQGEQNDDAKCQLLRAEWDDYGNPDEKHAQPHWHITANQAIEATFEKYAEITDDGGFIKTLNTKKSKIIDINRIHFAMNGNWLNGGTHIHTIDDETKIMNWLKGVLLHLKNELDYSKKRS